jgi:hypothetical protein
MSAKGPRRKKARLASQQPRAVAVQPNLPPSAEVQASIEEISRKLDVLISKVDKLTKSESETKSKPQDNQELAEQCRVTVRRKLGELVEQSAVKVGDGLMAHFGQLEAFIDAAFVDNCFEVTYGAKFKLNSKEKGKRRGLVENALRALADKYSRTHCTFAVRHFVFAD